MSRPKPRPKQPETPRPPKQPKFPNPPKKKRGT